MTRNTSLAIVIGLVLVGFGLRVYQIDAVSFRGDEAFTVLNWVSHPLLETLRGEIPLADPQPPLAFALFRAWSLIFGTSEFSMRILPALFSLPGIAALYVLGRRLGGNVTGLLAALLWAFHPFLIWHAQDAKAYAIWASFSAISLWLAMRALDRKRPVDWLLYVFSATITAYLYYLELLALLALNLYVLIRYRHERTVLKPWLLSQITIGFALAPWFLQSRLLFDSGYGGTTFPFEPVQIITWLIPSLNFGSRTLTDSLLATVGPIVLILLIAGLVLLWRANRHHALLLGLVGFLPVIALSVVSLRMNVFTPRYVLSVVPAYVLLAATAIRAPAAMVKRKAAGYSISTILAAGWFAIIVLSLGNYYFEPLQPGLYPKAPDWRALMTYLKASATPDDLVIQAAADEAFTYYFADYSASERLPANPRQSSDEIIQTVQDGLTAYRSIWLVARTPDDWPNRGVVPDWLRNHAQLIRHTSIGDLPVQQFMAWDVSDGEIEKTPLATFENVAHVIGVNTSSESPDSFTVLVYWQPINQTNQALKAFVHLTGPINPATGTPLWSQDDHYPQYQRISTTDWQPESRYRDVFTLPLSGIPAGTYTLSIGLYDPETGTRIPVADNDHYIAKTITLP